MPEAILTGGTEVLMFWQVRALQFKALRPKHDENVQMSE